MLDQIFKEHHFSSSFWELPSCFYRRELEGLDREEVFCVPYTECRTGSFIGTTIKP